MMRQQGRIAINILHQGDRMSKPATEIHYHSTIGIGGKIIIFTRMKETRSAQGPKHQIDYRLAINQYTIARTTTLGMLCLQELVKTEDHPIRTAFTHQISVFLEIPNLMMTKLNPTHHLQLIGPTRGIKTLKEITITGVNDHRMYPDQKLTSLQEWIVTRLEMMFRRIKRMLVPDQGLLLPTRRRMTNLNRAMMN